MARLLIDMDGVLCDLIKKWFSVYNTEHHDTLQPEQMVKWGPHMYAKKGKAIYRYLSQPGFFLDLEPIAGAVEGVQKLINLGHEVIVVTAAKHGHRDKLDWVQKNLPFLDYRHVVFAHRKELVRGDVLFDDAPHNLAAFLPYGLPVAMAHPYNEGAPGERVPDWSAFVELVQTRWCETARVGASAGDWRR